MKEGLMDCYIVRPAKVSDTEGIFHLIQRFPKELVQRPSSDIRSNIDRFLVATGKCNEGIIGCVSWEILLEPGLPQRPAVEVKSLAVASEYARLGIGTTLVNRAIKRIWQLGPVQVIVLTYLPSLFSGLGFSEVSKQNLYHKIYHGCIFCSKYLDPLQCEEIAMVKDVG